MAILKTKVELYLEANSKTWDAEKDNILLKNYSDGNGDIITTWNVSGLAKPTDEQLATYEDAANAEEALNTVYNNRRSEYPNENDCIHALLDGGDTLTELQAKRQEVKSKFPKP